MLIKVWRPFIYGLSKIGLAVMVAYFENNQPGANKSYKVLKNL